MNTLLKIDSSQDVDDLISKIFLEDISSQEREEKLDMLNDIYERSHTLLEFGISMDHFLGDK